MNLVIQMCVFFILRVEKIFFSEFMIRLRLMLNCQDADSQDSIKIELNSTHFELYICALLFYSCNDNTKEAKHSGNDKHVLYNELSPSIQAT